MKDDLTLSDLEWERECSILSAACDDAFVVIVKALLAVFLVGVAAIGAVVLWT